MNRDVIKVTVKDGEDKVITRPLYQYDYGIRIEFSGALPEERVRARFACIGDDHCEYGQDLVPVNGVALVDIPDALLQDGRDVGCWLQARGTGEAWGEVIPWGTTFLTVRIPVKRSFKAEDPETDQEEESE